MSFPIVNSLRIRYDDYLDYLKIIGYAQLMYLANEQEDAMADSRTLKERINAGSLDETFGELYCCGGAARERQKKRWLIVLDALTEAFGPDGETILLSSPGRTELAGNHTDHQHGLVLAGSVTLDMIAAARPNRDGLVRLRSEGYPGEDIPLGELLPRPEERHTTRALVRGVAAGFRDAGYAVGGFDLCMASTVLHGSGLSSSAAFEVLVGTVFNHLYCGGRVSAVDVAKIGRYAENVFFDKPCGLMDQLACSVGGALFIDFLDLANPRIEPVALDLAAAGHAMCIIDSGADHAGMSEIYAEIPAEMIAVAQCLGLPRLRGADKEALLADAVKIRKCAGDRAFLRALHFFDENERVERGARALREGDFTGFLALVDASGRSSWTCLQNVVVSGAVREQAVAASLALCAEALAGRGACRVHGGGFAGTIQAFVPLDMLDGFVRRMNLWLGEGRCHVLAIRKPGGVRIDV